VVRIQKTIRLDKELVDWAEREVKRKRFYSLSHAIEFALQQLKEQDTTSLRERG
jgi:Arc/MetJ-type ribon-helix-helix transcriptional regulator